MKVTDIRNGKVRCVGYKRLEKYFTIGKVYEVKDGKITNDRGFTYRCNDVMSYLSEWYEFEPVVEDKIVITHDGKITTATKYCADGSKVTATARCAPEDDFDFRIGAEIAMGRLVDKLVFASFNVVRVVFREGERSYSYKTRMKTAKVGMKIIVPVGECRHEAEATVVEIISGAEYDGEFAMSAMREIDIVEAPKHYNGKVICVKNKYSISNPVSVFTVGKVYDVVNGVIVSDTGYRSKKYDTVQHLCIGMGHTFIPLVE